jgi:hypothetical protein
VVKCQCVAIADVIVSSVFRPLVMRQRKIKE